MFISRNLSWPRGHMTQDNPPDLGLEHTCTARVPGRLVSFGQTLLSGMLKSTEMDEMVFTPEDRRCPVWGPCRLPGRGPSWVTGGQRSDLVREMLQIRDRKQRLPCCDSLVLRSEVTGQGCGSIRACSASLWAWVTPDPCENVGCSTCNPCVREVTQAIAGACWPAAK